MKYDPPVSTPFGQGGEGGASPAGRSAAEEQVVRLEAAVSRLEERAVQMLEAFRDDDVPTAGVAGENLRVSLFTEGGASAVLGQVRILE